MKDGENLTVAVLSTLSRLFRASAIIRARALGEKELALDGGSDNLDVTSTSARFQSRL